MSDGPDTPFVLAGKLVDWDPVTRVLQIGGEEFAVRPGVPVHDMLPGRSVTISGYERPGLEFWVVTQIQTNRFPS
jgi:hypothetical protein